LVLATGLRETTRANAVLRQYRWHVDADGDGKGYQSLLPVLLDEHRIAPAVPEPTVGRCTFDPRTDTSSAPVTLRLDNSASTLPVTFSVPGVIEPVEVRGGVARSVTAVVGGQATTFPVLADGAPLASPTVPGADCFTWDVDATAEAGWLADERSVAVTGTFRNGHAVTRLAAVMDAGSWGATEPVEVGPGEEVALTVGTGSRDVDADEVTFRVARVGGTGSHVVTAAYDAVRHAPAVGAPCVGQCVLDPRTEASSASVTLRYENARSTVPVVLSVDGRDDLTRTVAGGAV